MVREDIIGTLRTALQRGQNLQQTIQSLINAGYLKEEVDEAANMINNYVFQPPSIPPAKPNPQLPPRPVSQPAPLGQAQQVVSSYPMQSAQPNQLPPASFPQPVQQQYQQPQLQQIAQTVQKASDYFGNPREKASRTITIIMVVMLMILLGILVVVFLFKEELTNFINNL